MFLCDGLILPFQQFNLNTRQLPIGGLIIFFEEISLKIKINKLFKLFLNLFHHRDILCYPLLHINKKISSQPFFWNETTFFFFWNNNKNWQLSNATTVRACCHLVVKTDNYWNIIEIVVLLIKWIKERNESYKNVFLKIKIKWIYDGCNKMGKICVAKGNVNYFINSMNYKVLLILFIM